MKRLFYFRKFSVNILKNLKNSPNLYPCFSVNIVFNSFRMREQGGKKNKTSAFRPITEYYHFYTITIFI